MNKVWSLLYLSGMTIFYFFRSYPYRILRFIQHFFQWIPWVRKNHLPSRTFIEWSFDLLCYLLDLLLIPDVIELVLVWVRPNTRLLNCEEKKYVTKYFNDKVNTHNVRVNNKIHKWMASSTIAFVTFNTIHYSSTISIPVFIHEMVHIWQYQKFGSVYIYRALKAQNSKEGYDYGGVESLYVKMLNNHIFTDFNFEQQGEIFEDYCRMKESEEQQNFLVQASFEYFIGQVNDGKFS